MGITTMSALILSISGLFIVCSKWEHLLSVLLSIEYISLGVVFILINSFVFTDYFYALIYLTFTACEGALGLSILINMSRTYGSDLIKFF